MMESMTRRLHPRRRPCVAVRAGLFIGLAWAAGPLLSQSNGGPGMPVFHDDGQLDLPADFARWILAGASLGLSYSEGSNGREMFHETLIEPAAFDHFQRTGTFRDGTMLALLLHPAGESVLPQRRGRYAGPVGMVEIAVKSERFASGWGYFGFSPAGGKGRAKTVARAFRRASCSACHEQHARYDNVFLQFYPLLASAAPAGSPAAAAVLAAGGSQRPMAGTAVDAAASAALALAGLDPVLLVEGREDEGKPEIVVIHEGFEYRFVSEPNRRAFAADPARYSSCRSIETLVP